MYILALFLAIAFIAILTMMAVQISWWRRGHHVITASQLIARMVYAGVILCVLAMMFIGRFVLKWESTRAEVIYWLGILAIVIMIAIVAAGDWRQVARIQEKQQRQLYHELVEAMRQGLPPKDSREHTPTDREE
jgi:amino acid transporter